MHEARPNVATSSSIFTSVRLQEPRSLHLPQRTTETSCMGDTPPWGSEATNLIKYSK